LPELFNSNPVLSPYKTALACLNSFKNIFPDIFPSISAKFVINPEVLGDFCLLLLLAAGGWLLAAGCWRLAAGCWLLAAAARRKPCLLLPVA
jgi:hypothetical protein